MSTGNKSAGGKTEAKAERKNHSPEDEPSLGKAKSVKKAIELFEEKLAKGDVKPTVGEFVRLLELQKEIDADEPREIKVTWVEPDETESSEK